ncbi:MAG: Flp pilus assembly complex ATPase component TadA [Chloroflexota bacterium]|nr:Flp pilus assembly complex ATPase component TadA [Chloroflexota bacterium]
MFDPRSPYQRRMWHYESDRPLSVAQLIAAGSLDARAAALLWLLVERHSSVIVSGPTDPTPGVGKTTTLNALLGFLPLGSTLVYTMGMFEDFSFVSEVEAATTCVLANEVSDHLRIYMWGRNARRLLSLPGEGFAIATSCHADTISDTLAMLRQDLRLPAEETRRLGVIVNIGLVGSHWPYQRRFLTINYLRPAGGDDEPYGVSLLPLATWEPRDDSFVPATPEALAELAGLLAISPDDLEAAIQRRVARLEALVVNGAGAGLRQMRAAVDALYAEEHGLPASADDDDDNDNGGDDDD